MEDTKPKNEITVAEISSLSVEQDKLNALAEKWKETPDCSKTEGYNLAKDGWREARQIRLNVADRVTNMKREIKKGVAARIERIEEVAEHVLGIAEPIEKRLKAEISAIDDAKKVAAAEKKAAEAKRVAEIEVAIKRITALGQIPFSSSVAEIEESIKKAEAMELNTGVYHEQLPKAVYIMEGVKENLKSCLNTAIEREEAAEKIEIEKENLRLERVAIEELAEEKRKEEEAAAELEKAAEAKREAARLEQQRIDQENRDAEEAELEKKRLEIKEEQDKLEEERQLAKEETERKEAAKKAALEEAETKRIAKLGEERQEELTAEGIEGAEKIVGLGELNDREWRKLFAAEVESKKQADLKEQEAVDKKEKRKLSANSDPERFISELFDGKISYFEYKL